MSFSGNLISRNLRVGLQRETVYSYFTVLRKELLTFILRNYTAFLHQSITNHFADPDEDGKIILNILLRSCVVRA
jgi:hypothetical protein